MSELDQGLRATDTLAGRSLQFGHLSVLPAERELRLSGVPVALAPKAFDLLMMLIEHRHRVVVFDEILARVWKRRAFSRGVIAQAVRQLRCAMRDDAQHPRWVKSYHGIGYRFIGEVSDQGGPASSRQGATQLLPDERAGGDRADGDRADDVPDGPVQALFAQACVALDRCDFAALDAILATMREAGVDGDGKDARIYEAILAAQALLVRGELKAALQRVRELRASIDAHVHPLARIELHLTAARIESKATCMEDALLSIESVWGTANRSGTKRQKSYCALTFGLILLRLGLNDLAAHWFQRARAVSCAGDEWLIKISADLNLIALKVARANDAERLARRGKAPDWDALLADIESIRVRARAAEVPTDVSAALMVNRAVALWRLGRIDEAVTTLEDQVATFEAGHRLDRLASTSVYLAEIFLQSGKPGHALRACMRAIDACDAIGAMGIRPLGYRHLLELASTASEQSGDGIGALEYLRRSVQLDCVLAEVEARGRAALLAVRLETGLSGEPVGR